MSAGVPVVSRVLSGFALALCLGSGAITHADPGGQLYGDPDAAAQYWRYQHQQDCGLMAVADVVGQITGRQPAQPGIQLRAALTKSPNHRGAVYRFDGTAPEDLVVILRQFGIDSELTTGNTLATIENDLAGGRKVIAALNAATIWNDPKGQRTKADHAVVVTGVDTRTDMVHLNDSGIPTGRDEQISIAAFTQAWATSNDLLIVA